MEWILISALAAAGGLILAAALTALQRRRAAEVKARFRGRRVFGIASNANFFGEESRGTGQVRGNGVLALAEGELYFKMWAPARELSIPFNALLGAEIVRSHLKKSKGRPLLRVRYLDPQGNEDSAAWLVGRPERWKDALDRIIAAAPRS